LFRYILSNRLNHLWDYLNVQKEKYETLSYATSVTLDIVTLIKSHETTEIVYKVLVLCLFELVVN